MAILVLMYAKVIFFITTVQQYRFSSKFYRWNIFNTIFYALWSIYFITKL